jgi:integrase
MPDRKPAVAPFPFTDRAIAKLKLPSSGVKDYIAYDAGMPGLGVRVSAKSKRFIYQERQPDGRQHRETIGRFPTLTVEAARQGVKARAGKVAVGVDLRAAKEAAKQARKEAHAGAAYTLDAVLDLFVEARAPHSRGKYVTNLVAGIRREYGPLLKRPITSITPEELESGWKKLTGLPAAAKVLYASVRRVFNWATRNGPKLKYNPVKEASPPEVKLRPRDRKLSGEECRLIWNACEKLGVPGMFIRFLMGSVVRYDEAVRATWDELSQDFSRWVIPRERMKRGENSHIVIPPTILRELLAKLPRYADTKLLFTSGKKGRKSSVPAPFTGSTSLMRNLMTALASQINRPFVFHDFRQGAVSWMVENGVRALTADRLLAHAKSTEVGVVGSVYQQAELLLERAEALEKWTRMLAGVSADSVPESSKLGPDTSAAQPERVETRTVLVSPIEDPDALPISAVKRVAAYGDLGMKVLANPEVVRANAYLSTTPLEEKYEDTYGDRAHEEAFLEWARRAVRLHIDARPQVRANVVEADRKVWGERLREYRESAAADRQREKRARAAADSMRDQPGQEEFVQKEDAAADMAGMLAKQAEDAATTCEQILKVIPTINDPRVAKNLSLRAIKEGKAHSRGAQEEMGKLIREICGRPHDAAAIAYANALGGFPVTKAMGRRRRKAAS